MYLGLFLGFYAASLLFLLFFGFWVLRLFGFGGFLASCCQLLSGRSCSPLTFLGFVALLPQLLSSAADNGYRAVEIALNAVVSREAACGGGAAPSPAPPPALG